MFHHSRFIYPMFPEQKPRPFDFCFGLWHSGWASELLHHQFWLKARQNHGITMDQPWGSPGIQQGICGSGASWSREPTWLWRPSHWVGGPERCKSFSTSTGATEEATKQKTWKHIRWYPYGSICVFQMIPSVKKKQSPHCLMVKPSSSSTSFQKVNSPMNKNREGTTSSFRHYREAISYALYKRFPSARSLLVVWGPGGPQNLVDDLKSRRCTRIFGGVWKGISSICSEFLLDVLLDFLVSLILWMGFDGMYTPQKWRTRGTFKMGSQFHDYPWLSMKKK